MITLVLGGARSGKSAVAESLAGSLRPPFTYVATLEVGDDAELAARVAAHRARRPSAWATVETPAELTSVLEAAEGTVLIDSLGPWVAATAGMMVDDTAFCAALARRADDTVVVSEEVGLGVHPSSEAGRRFRDALGSLNQAVAEVADEVLLVVAGRVLRLEEPGAR